MTVASDVKQQLISARDIQADHLILVCVPKWNELTANHCVD